MRKMIFFIKKINITARTMAEYAWVMLMMCGDSYLPGALTLCHSLIETKTKADIVIMVTSDVSAEAREQLQKLDKVKVKQVDYITGEFKGKMSNKQKEKYGKWMNKIPTKLNVLTLTEYKKIIMLDLDVIVTTNCDELFEMPAPAGLWEFYQDVDTRTRKRYFRSQTSYKLANLKHGDKVPPSLVDQALSSTFVCWGTSLILTPNIDDFNNILQLVRDSFYRPGCMSGFEEQIIAFYYRDRWTKIKSTYSLVPWKPWNGIPTDCLDGKILHFHGSTKPWEYRETDEEVTKWPDVALWHSYYRKYKQSTQ